MHEINLVYIDLGQAEQKVECIAEKPSLSCNTIGQFVCFCVRARESRQQGIKFASFVIVYICFYLRT